MPQVPAYIRNADWGAYIKVKESGKNAWAEHIHNSLNKPKYHIETKYEGDGIVSAKIVPPLIPPEFTNQDVGKKPITKQFSARKKK